MKPTIGMFPPSGWHYEQDGVRIDASGYDTLLIAVETFRANNNLPQGDVEADVDEYICSRWPHFCGIYTHAAAEEKKIPALLLDDVRIWSMNLLGGEGYNMVSDELADARAAICEQCPNNTNWKSSCRTCVSTVERQLATVRQARDVYHSANLGGCSVNRFDARTAVFLDAEALTPAAGLPDFCWLLTASSASASAPEAAAEPEPLFSPEELPDLVREFSPPIEEQASAAAVTPDELSADVPAQSEATEPAIEPEPTA